MRTKSTIFKFARYYVLTIIVTMAGTALSFYAYNRSIENRSQRMMLNFSQESSSLFLGLKDEFILHEEQLKSLRNLYRASELVEEREFKEFVQPLLSWHDDVLAYMWIPVQYSDQQHSSYKVLPPQYRVCSDPNSPLRNYDIVSNKSAVKVFEKLKDHKQDIFATDIYLVDLPNKSSFIFICMPFYREGSYIEGFLACVIDIEKTAKTVGLVTKKPLTLSVSTRPSDSISIVSETPIPVSRRMLDLAGAPVLAEVRATQSYVADFFGWQSRFILMLGLFSTVLMGTLVFSQAKAKAALERLVRRRTEELAHKNEELESIINVSSHDLKSPLVNIAGFGQELRYGCLEVKQALETSSDLETIKRKIGPIINRDMPESVDFIESNVSKMSAVQDGLLQLSRLGRIELNKQHLNMNEFMTKGIESMKVSISQHGASVTHDDLPDCYGDMNQLSRVFTNLIDNALKYSAADRKTVVKISGHRTASHIIYCVEDNGIGMDPAHANKIFDPFQRLHPEDKIHGEGLGLAIVKRLITLHGGEVWVETEPGKGSRFFISLPRQT